MTEPTGSEVRAEEVTGHSVRDSYLRGYAEGLLAQGSLLLALTDGSTAETVDAMEAEIRAKAARQRAGAASTLLPPYARAAAAGWVQASDEASGLAMKALRSDAWAQYRIGRRSRTVIVGRLP